MRGPKLLPHRVPEDSPKDLSDHPRVPVPVFWLHRLHTPSVAQ